MGTAILWFHQDLRLEDNSAIAEAERAGHSLVPVFIWAPEEQGEWAPGAASNWWCHHALESLDADLKRRGSRLVIRQAQPGQSSEEVLLALAKETKADTICWNVRHDPRLRQRDATLAETLRSRSIDTRVTESTVLFSPDQIANKSGKPFQVFTPLWRHYQTLEIPRPAVSTLDRFQPATELPSSTGVKELGLLPKIPWDTGFQTFWGTPNRETLTARLDTFATEAAAAYSERRDTPSDDGTSRLSPSLHFGQIGPRELWWRLASLPGDAQVIRDGILRQLVWREFAHQLLYHFPHTTTQPLREEFGAFPWEPSETFLQAWREGRTGYPIVDAGLRQLWQTGWMHNRVRMIVGSLLVKHLLQPWQEGARWFWDTLVDADLPNNTMGWQWIAGCGADAAPYFRIFNPITQGERFDPRGDYVRRYVPELAQIPHKFIHKPWELGDLDLLGCGVTLGKDYPVPILPHPEGRKRALDAFQRMRDRRRP